MVDHTTTQIPLAVTDAQLMEALAGRFETAGWEDIGAFLGRTFLHQVGGSEAGVTGFLEIGLERIEAAARVVLTDYSKEVHHG